MTSFEGDDPPYCSATAGSADGNVVVGWSGGHINEDGFYVSATEEAFRWTESGGVVGLDPPSGQTYLRASDVSGDAFS